MSAFPFPNSLLGDFSRLLANTVIYSIAVYYVEVFRQEPAKQDITDFRVMVSGMMVFTIFNAVRIILKHRAHPVIKHVSDESLWRMIRTTFEGEKPKKAHGARLAQSKQRIPQHVPMAPVDGLTPASAIRQIRNLAVDTSRSEDDRLKLLQLLLHLSWRGTLNNLPLFLLVYNHAPEQLLKELLTFFSVTDLDQLKSRLAMPQVDTLLSSLIRRMGGVIRRPKVRGARIADIAPTFALGIRMPYANYFLNQYRRR